MDQLERPVEAEGVEQSGSLQSGEDSDTRFASDAIHWFGVYSALLQLAVASDLPQKAAWFTGRREFWRRRWMELRRPGA